jgi:ABC-type dipeptide/oligopeptide/nickel transport system permease component
MTNFTSYLIQRLIASLITLLGVSLLVFLLVRLLPGDPARTIAGLLASEEEIAQVRVEQGLDQPLPVQYARFISRLAQGDLGVSASTKRPVAAEIADRLPNSARLAIAAIVLTTLIGVTAGVVAAIGKGAWFDHLISFGSLLGISMPSYWLGLTLIVFFAVQLRWLPAAGSDQPTSVILPALTLTLVLLAFVVRITRASMLEVFDQNYIQTARAKGLHERLVIYRHALKNALIPVLTVLGLQFAGLVSGAVFVETIFGWPGLGQLLTNAIFSRDYPMIQGTVLFIALVFILVNLAVDLLYAAVDPRIRYG